MQQNQARQGPPMQQGAAPSGAPMGLGGPQQQQQPGMSNEDGMDFAVGSEAATPEEQKQYDQFVDNAYKLIYDERTQEAVLKSLGGGGDPILGLANTAATVVLQVETQAESKGAELADGVVFNAGVEVTEDLAGFAKQAGVYDYTEQDVESAFYRAVDIYRELKASAGGIDRERYAAEFQALMEADKAGTLGDKLPILKKGAQQQQAPARPPGAPAAGVPQKGM